jgi:enoyl-CoA hydratase/carnithine racemase
MLGVDVNGGVGSVVIDRPERKNAFSEAMWGELASIVRGLDEDPGVRVVVVRSADRAVFSAGADVEDFKRVADDPGRAQEGLRLIRSGFEALIAMKTPTIAAISGACHGGGAALAVCCDVRIADTTARFSIPPARLGLLYPYPALRRLMWMIGPGRAKDLLFTARTFDAAEAETLGFVDELVVPERLEQRVDEVAASIAAVSQSAVRAMKQVFSAIEAADPDAARRAEALELAALQSDDHREGVVAFLDKRPPRFG